MCRTRELWSGKVSAGDRLGEEGDALEGIKPSTWRERGSDYEEKSFLVDEGAAERNIPQYTFNILQAAEAEPEMVRAIIHDEAPDVASKFELDTIDVASEDWYKELVDALTYLSVDKHEDYGRRYWYLPWKKAKEMNPELLGDGRKVIHPGQDAEVVEEDDEPDEQVNSAADANW